VVTVPSAAEIAYTDRRGVFVISNLRATAYNIRVSMSRFVAASRTVQLTAGGTLDLVISLQTPPTETLTRGRTSDIAVNQHIIDILRGQRSTQPLLRLAPVEEPSASFRFVDEYSGFLQLYSAKVETVEGVTEGIGSKFSVTAPVSPDVKITLRGRFSELPTEMNTFEASVDLAASENRRSQFGLSLRQNGVGGVMQALEDTSREVRVQYGDSLQWSRRLAVEYGAQLGSIEAYNERKYVRPRFAIAWSATPRTKLKVGVTSQAPAVYDTMGGKNGLDGGAYEPFAPSRRFHGEIVLARLSDQTTISVAAFGDRAEAQSMFAGARGERKLIVLDGRRISASGARVELKREFGNYSAGVAYTNATGIGLRRQVRSLDELITQLEARRFHMVTTRFHANIPLTATELTAIYQWMPSVSAVPIDPYQTFSESNEPTLSVIVAQELPTLRPFGGRVQAIVDARNLLEPSLNSRRIQLAQSPRLIKGGLNIQF
jgi:hypothetical protein